MPTDLSDDLTDQIFDFMVRDFSKHALSIYSLSNSTENQMEICMKMVKKQVVNTERYDKIWEQHVYSLKDSYQMND